MFQPSLVAIFREVFYEVYVTKNSQPVYKYNISSFKYVVEYMLKYEIQIKLFVLNLLE
jgi:hypothetical protein